MAVGILIVVLLIFAVLGVGTYFLYFKKKSDEPLSTTPDTKTNPFTDIKTPSTDPRVSVWSKGVTFQDDVATLGTSRVKVSPMPNLPTTTNVKYSITMDIYIPAKQTKEQFREILVSGDAPTWDGNKQCFAATGSSQPLIYLAPDNKIGFRHTSGIEDATKPGCLTPIPTDASSENELPSAIWQNVTLTLGNKELDVYIQGSKKGAATMTDDPKWNRDSWYWNNNQNGEGLQIRNAYFFEEILTAEDISSLKVPVTTPYMEHVLRYSYQTYKY